MQSLAPETLAGDNRYYCSHCDKLRDAERSHQIETVPPTLNFSLLRFVFDPKTFERKKSKTTIAFPPKINMRPYMSDKKGEDLWYELKGVIEHKGPSVSSNAYKRFPHARV
jgi:ubiquitin C-terminal hydrolase